jgi:NADH:ubiquinone oxidoreductase subunit K
MIISFLTRLIGFYRLFSRYNVVACILGLGVILLGTNMNFLFTIAQPTGYVTMVNLVFLLATGILVKLASVLVPQMELKELTGKKYR